MTIPDRTPPPGRLMRIAARGLTMLLLTMLLLTMLGGGPAAAADAGEYEVKAAFIYNFAKFAVWPPTAFADPRAPLVLCTLDDPEFGATLSALQGKPVGDRRLVVREVVPREAMGCHLLFIGRSLQTRSLDILKFLNAQPILTIGDADGFANRGGTINLTLADSRVRFEVNLKALERTGVTLSSQVLRLARIVEDAP